MTSGFGTSQDAPSIGHRCNAYPEANQVLDIFRQPITSIFESHHIAVDVLGGMSLLYLLRSVTWPLVDAFSFNL